MTDENPLQKTAYNFRAQFAGNPYADLFGAALKSPGSANNLNRWSDRAKDEGCCLSGDKKVNLSQKDKDLEDEELEKRGVLRIFYFLS